MIEIPLTQGKIAMIDDADWPKVSNFKWCASKERNTYYAVTHVPGSGLKHGKHFRLHRLILDAPEGVLVDHKDRNGLNCCRDNIRLCTPYQNGINCKLPSNNTTGIKGVYFDARWGTWYSHISINGKLKHLGCFRTIDEAAQARLEAAAKYYGEFASNNP